MRKFETTVLITSHKVEGKRYTFKPGDIFEEKYILPVKVKAYLKKGILKEVSGDAVTEDVKPAKVRSSGIHPKNENRDED